MRIETFGSTVVAISEAAELLEKRFETKTVDWDGLTHQGPRLISKSRTKKIIGPPYDMGKLLNLLDTDEYHSGCVEATAQAVLMNFECHHPKAKKWFMDAQYPACEDESTLLTELLRFHLACGNGFMVKMRSTTGEWRGLERLLPNQVGIVENYDEYNFWTPDYIQHAAGLRKDLPYADVIHFKRSTHRSNAWGLASLPVVLNLQILEEIKVFDYNNFRNGLMVDYFMIVEGGTLADNVIYDAEGNEVIQDAFSQIREALREAKGNKRSHATILIESESKDARIRLEPLRQHDRDGGFIQLKKDLREGIFAYHRVPPRVVSQWVTGQLGGSSNEDMTLFYNFVIKPLQYRLALMLSNEFNWEWPDWGVKPADFDFGDLTEALRSPDERLFWDERNK